jgi:general secretion pathway protein M
MTGVIVVSSLASVLTTKIEHIDDMRRELFRLDQIIARKPADPPPQIPVQSDPVFLEGASVSVIQAGLQERVASVAAASGATITSTSGTPQMQIDGVDYVGLRADFDGSLQAVHEVIRQLETSRPPLIIRRASIHSTNAYPQGIPNEPIHLSAQISIYGAVSGSVAPARREATP